MSQLLLTILTHWIILYAELCQTSAQPAIVDLSFYNRCATIRWKSRCPSVDNTEVSDIVYGCSPGVISDSDLKSVRHEARGGQNYQEAQLVLPILDVGSWSCIFKINTVYSSDDENCESRNSTCFYVNVETYSKNSGKITSMQGLI